MKIIAEIGCNHTGDMDIACEMVQVAAQECGADVVKFQKRCPRELLSAEEYAGPHPCPHNSYGRAYGEHREVLELTAADHAELKAVCEHYGVVYSTSVWDMTSAREIVELNPAMIKVPSARNTHWPMLRLLCATYPGKIHVSLGMTTRIEEARIMHLFYEQGRARDVVLYACTSGYPVDFCDVCLLDITRLRTRWANTMDAVGFSGHHLGIAVDIAAMVLGAQYLERHFTLDRTWKGTDHAASLEPQGLKKLVRDVRNVEAAMMYKDPEILDVETIQRAKLKRSDKT